MMGASIQYYFWFSIYRAIGYSILGNISELIGIILILIGLILVGVLASVLFKSYQQTRARPTLYFFLAFIFFIMAAFFLFMERLCYSTLGNIIIGDISAIIGTIMVGFALFFINLFAFHNTIPDHVKIASSIIGAVTALYIFISSYAILTGPPNMDVINFEIIYINPVIDILIYCTTIPIMAIGPLAFFYYTIKSRNENKPNSIRSLWFGIGLLCFGIGFIAEISPFFPTELSVIFRSTYSISAIILYICFKMPEWFKSRIGWTQ